MEPRDVGSQLSVTTVYPYSTLFSLPRHCHLLRLAATGSRRRGEGGMDARAAKIAGCPWRDQDVAAYEPQVSDVGNEASCLWVVHKRAYRIVGSGGMVISDMARGYARKRPLNHYRGHTCPAHARYPPFSYRPAYGTVAQRGARVRSFMLRRPRNRKRRWKRKPRRRNLWPSTGRYAMCTVSEGAVPTVSVVDFFFVFG